MSEENTNYQKEKKGRMWPETEAKVIRKGSLMLQGKKRYVAILKTFINGEHKYELMMSVGLLHTQEEKLSPKSPDIKGPVTIDGESYLFSGWKETSEQGVSYTNVSLLAKTNEKNQDF
tara:strand:+ start:31509 stop:31862 length:354 start_codon:yes stop_codon:yes gene_type:complete